MMDQAVAEYFRNSGDRQWLRAHRIAHAKYQLTRPDNDAGDIAFWKDVLAALE